MSILDDICDYYKKKKASSFPYGLVAANLFVFLYLMIFYNYNKLQFFDRITILNLCHKLLFSLFNRIKKD